MIRYRAGYKYWLAETYRRQIDISGIAGGITQDIVTEYVLLSVDGWLTIQRGYAWDGATGYPDVPEIIEASLVHDAGYQLMRERYLDRTLYQEKFDSVLKEICLEKGMTHFLAQAIFNAVHSLGDQFAGPANDRPVITLP